MSTSLAPFMGPQWAAYQSAWEQNMKAVGYHKPVILIVQTRWQDIELPRPEPGPRDLLVKVAFAVSVNPGRPRRSARNRAPTDRSLLMCSVGMRSVP